MRERKWGSKEIGGKKEEDLKGSYINDTSVSVTSDTNLLNLNYKRNC